MRTARATQKQANMALEVGKSALLGVIISFVLVVLYAVALKEELLQVSTMGLFTTVIKVICAAAAGLIAVRRCKKRLWLYGALAGTLYAVLAFIVFSAVAGTLYVSIALLSDIAANAEIAAPISRHADFLRLAKCAARGVKLRYADV